jgi:hypothetical protein
VRVWVGLDGARLASLRDGTPWDGEVVAAESEDEQHELEALEAAAEDGPVVVVAEVDEGADVTFADLDALHVDADGSGHLAWYAPQEVDAVLALLADRA